MPIAGVASRTEKSARAFLSLFDAPPPYLPLPELIAAADLIIEAAGGSVVPELAEKVFAAKKDLMVISVGALLDHPEIIEKSRQTGCRLYCPSGAIAGLDGIKSASVGQITHITHTRASGRIHGPGQFISALLWMHWFLGTIRPAGSVDQFVSCVNFRTQLVRLTWSLRQIGFTKQVIQGTTSVHFVKGWNIRTSSISRERLLAGAHQNWVEQIIESTDGTVELLPAGLREEFEFCARQAGKGFGSKQRTTRGVRVQSSCLAPPEAQHE